jgi:hypothetical protein
VGFALFNQKILRKGKMYTEDLYRRSKFFAVRYLLDITKLPTTVSLLLEWNSIYV